MANASPSSFITSVTRNPVVVRLNNGSNFKGFHRIIFRYSCMFG